MSRSGATRQRTHVILSCLHPFHTDIKPRNLDTVYCMKCGCYRDYIEREPTWKAQCETCSRMKSATGELTSRTKAASHALRFPGHSVVITCDGVAVETVRHDAPTLADEPAF